MIKENPPGTKDFHLLDSDDPPPIKPLCISIKLQIQKARQAKNMTQDDLAKCLCMQPNNIKNFESGKQIPTKQELKKIEKALHVKLI
jgi:putative transcription factor